ncbi:MAG: MotA/TolQ/ExbB proton channel family protein [Elusimicrobiota bacterium]|nr:MotA/TolQ/ExbB proton channel family protein [Elusimicrobiota bacterium]
MENEHITPGGGFFKQSFIILLIMAAIYLQEGMPGFRPFLNLEAALLVFGGTLCLTWTAYPLKELFRPSGPEVLLHAAGCAAAMGALTTVLGMILMLASVDDVAQIPRRMALALSGLFLGLVLSEVVLAPMAARLAAARKREENKPAAPSAAGKRLFLWFLTLGIVSFSMMTVFFALSLSAPPAVMR